MKRELIIEAAALYWPLSLAVLMLCVMRPPRRERGMIAMTCMWQAASIALLNALAQYLGWWEFSESRWKVFGMPASLYLGWVILWGVVAILLMKRLGIVWTVIVLFGFDLLMMPMMQPTLMLGNYWMVGEVCIIFGALCPGLLLARWVMFDVRPELRATCVSFAFAILVTVVFPLIGSGETISEVSQRIMSQPIWVRWGGLAILLMFALPGLAAVMDFARVGKGTPIPFDPPKYLVSSGAYSYIANPMQASIFWVLMLEGVFLWNGVCVLLAVVSVIYSEGLARWSEQEDLRKRYGGKWIRYREVQPRWRFRSVPKMLNDSFATLYFAESCGTCSEVGAWFVRQSPQGLALRPAENCSDGMPSRITYENQAGQKRYGVDAIAAALQHIHLGWAWVAWLIQIPGVVHTVQLAMDAAGASRGLKPIK